VGAAKATAIEGVGPGVAERWYVLAILTLVYAMNIADRFVVSTLLEPIRLSLHLSDGNVSLITGIPLALFYVCVGIPVAVLADHANRRNIIAVSLALWSAMTAACGLATNLWQFALARVCVGIGEAGGTPPSTSLLADKFLARDRPMAMTIFALGAPIGAWIGASMAGAIAARYTWREAFLVLGIPGVVIGLLVYFTVREPVRGSYDATPPPQGHSLADVLRFLVRQRSAFHIIAGGTIATLWGWGLLWWTPTYLMREYGMTVDEASATLGPMHLVAGSVATIATGLLVSARVAIDPRRVVWLLGGVIALATVPSIIVYWTHSRALAVGMLWIVVPAIYFFIGPSLGLLANVVPATMRAQVVAVLLFTANVANLIIAPQGIGLASYLLEPTLGSNAESLRWALIVLAPTGFWAAWHYLTSARTLRQEQAAVSGG
jgi:predicted MFS family arabinose efflux permease